MGEFQALWADIEPILDGHFGETFSIEPRCPPTGPDGRADPNGRSVPDTSRPAQTFTGIWTDPHTVIRPTNRTGHPAGESQRFGDEKPNVDFTTTALPYFVKIGDIVTRSATGQRYAVSDVGSDGFTRSAMSLTAGRGRA